MKMKTATEYTFTRNAQAVTTASKPSIKIGSEHVQVDPLLLFQQLIIACDDTQLEELFQCDLCVYPTLLFYMSLSLADAMWSRLTQESKSQPQGDGGVLHRVPLPRGSLMCKDLCDLYCTYVCRKYGRVMVVFDGYDELSTKAMTQQMQLSPSQKPGYFSLESPKQATLSVLVEQGSTKCRLCNAPC